MNHTITTTNRREALQQMLAVTMGTSLLGLSSCKDSSTEAKTQTTANTKTIIPCKPLNIPPEDKPLEAPRRFEYAYQGKINTNQQPVCLCRSTGDAKTNGPLTTSS
ncbi:hypothetical protein [Terrimonas pollutisoli]|uniref:hypothetical protein n=1 Tax=Terrimonas pollutisoli TaxID=3034147 RepID=UPI0023EAD9F8|nr:hypothetical protein [Terrimonas sp. H1YJ31]